MFVEIYNQAMAAQSAQLDQLVGIGLRKALEFLIKDYTVYKQPKSAEEIRTMPLGKCIGLYVDDEKVKACAKRAAWLENDDENYVRKWETKDIKDLKVLVKLTENWIENCLLMEMYLSDMNSDE